MEGYWGFVVVGGPLVLALVLLWAMTHNRQSRRQEQRTDAATRQLYREEAEEERRDEAG